MLKKKFKLKKINFEELFKIAKKYKNNDLRIFKINSEKEKKFAVFLSKKDFKKAIERNRIKRLIYEIIRRNLDKIPNGLFIIFPKQSCLKLNFKELEEKIIDILVNKISTRN